MPGENHLGLFGNLARGAAASRDKVRYGFADAMKHTIRDKLIPFGTHWEMLAIPVVLFVLVAVFVDLRPVVDENFFFATSDPGVRQQKTIEKHFPSKPEIILAVSSPEISSPHYLPSLQKL